MRFFLWLAWRYLWSSKAYRGEILYLSLLGLALGVAALVVAMAVVSGYQSTLRRAVIDITGHVIVTGQRPLAEQGRQVAEQMAPLLGESLVAQTAFVQLEAIVAHEGQVSGVFIEGMDPDNFTEVLNLEGRLLEGRFLESNVTLPEALIGRGLASRLGLGVGDEIRLVIPASAGFDGGGVRSRLQRFQVVGILDLGRYDFNLRFVGVELKQAQEFAQIGDYITGFRLRLSSDDLARPASLSLGRELGRLVFVTDWQDINRSLFEAAALEKIVIFLVLSLMIVAASFTVASTLLISVVRRYRDISVLRAMGATSRNIWQLFTLQGLLIGFVGALLGIGLGLLGCWAFIWGLETFAIFPAEIYKLDSIELDLRFTDLLVIVLACVGVCFLATLGPAKKGAKLSPVEGLRYE